MWNLNYDQMNLSVKQKQTQRCKEQICGCQGRGEEWEGRTGSLGLADANFINRMYKQQGPSVQHRELYSISCDKPNGKQYEKEYIYI